MVIVIIGPAGAGKTLIGRALAHELGWRFVEGDDHHSPAAIALTDADRAPWLASLHDILAAVLDRREHLVLACSALKERYRLTLRGDLRTVRFVYLKSDEPTLRRRLAERGGRFAGPALLASQLADLEEPADALTIDALQALERIIATIRRELGI